MAFPSFPMRRLLSPAGLRLHFTHCSQLGRRSMAQAPSRTTKVSKYRNPFTNSGFDVPTITVLGLCLAGFGFEQWAQLQASRYGNSKPLQFIRENLVLSLSNIRDGKWWTLITYSFIHSNTMHLVFNAWTILSFGPAIISVFGTSAFVIGWLGAALSGAGAGLWWDKKKGDERRPAYIVGASGSVFAFVTMLTLLGPTLPVQIFMIIPMPIWGAMLGTVGMSIACLANSWLPHIGHAGHLGGIAFGALYYMTRLRRRLPIRRV